MGLAQPTRYIFAVRRWDPAISYTNSGVFFGDATKVPDYIIARNFDPETLQPTTSINGSLYAGRVFWWGPSSSSAPTSVYIQTVVVDPTEAVSTAVADNPVSNPMGLSGSGLFYNQLTSDDAGGIGYLLGTNNLNYETLSPDVHAAPTNSTALVNLALRPGVDKVRFVPHPLDSQTGAFAAFTNQFTDSYISNNVVSHQAVEREINQPDFLFCAGDNGIGKTWTPFFARTGTTNWLNNSDLNGNTNQPGPGVIKPQVRVTFHKVGDFVETTESYLQTTPIDQGWGSFGLSTNPPIFYPASTPSTSSPLTIGLRLANGSVLTQRYDWHLPVPFGGTAFLQTSTNLAQWDPVCTVTNRGNVVEWIHSGISQSQRFFRVLPGSP
jgi:hypothetical protein